MYKGPSSPPEGIGFSSVVPSMGAISRQESTRYTRRIPSNFSSKAFSSCSQLLSLSTESAGIVRWGQRACSLTPYA